MERGLEKSCVVWSGFYSMAVVIFMTHACLGWRKLTLAQSLKIPKEHPVLCEVSRIPHFLSNRFGVDFFSSSRSLFKMSEYQCLK